MDHRRAAHPKPTPTSLHERFASLLDTTGVLAATLRLRKHVPISTITVVTYHRIAEPGDEPFDPEVVDGTPAQFRHQVATLARAGTPIGIDTLIRGLDGAPLPRSPILITFDDGYRTCRDVALPILRELGVPATFFIATGFPSGPRLYWWEQIAVVLHAARGRTATVTYPRPLRIDADDPRSRRVLDDVVKNACDLDLDRFLSELRTALGVPWDAEYEAALARSLIMGWDDIRALAAAGMDIESHTRHHRVLDTLDDARLHEELVGARTDLETALGRPVRALAYPVGRCPSVRTQRAVADAGYRIAFTNGTGLNHAWAGPIQPFAIRRLSTERTSSNAMFLAEVLIPGFAQ